MKNSILLLIGIAMTLNLYAKDPYKAILGKWTIEDQNHVIEFVKSGSEYEAIVVEARDPSFIGKKQITSLKHKKGDSYKDGTLHNLQKGRTAKCSAELISDTELELKVSIGFMTKKQVWTRVTQDEPAPVENAF